MKKITAISFALLLLLSACSLPASAPVEAVPPSAATVAAPTTVPPTETELPTLVPSTATLTFTPIPPTASQTPSNTPIPVVESLDATITSDLLSCRYGPGSEYLYLYGLKKGANIQIIGRTNGNNWVLVAGKSLCWVNAKFIEVKGDPQTLQAKYPDGYQLPVSPYYAAPTVLSAKRNGNSITVTWTEVTLRAGDEEDADMFIYIIEVWRCEGGKSIFDPLASNYPEVTFVDDGSCDIPSHGRVFFQEKHGFAGPTEIPWP